MAGYDPDALLASPQAQQTQQPTTQPASSPQGYDPDALLASASATKPVLTPQTNQPAELRQSQDSFGSILGQSNVGRLIHGAAEPVAAVAEGITKLAPQVALPMADPNGFPIDYGYGPGVVPKEALQGVRNAVPTYERNYELARPGGRDLNEEGKNTEPDIVSDIGQALPFMIGVGEVKAAQQAANKKEALKQAGQELLRVMKLGAASGVSTPTNSTDLHDDVYDFLKEKAIQAGLGATIGVGGKVAGDIISPNVNKQTQMLLDSGINPTGGQLARQSANPLIQGLGHTEALSSGLPVVGPAIQQAQDRAMFDLNKSVGNIALSDAKLAPVSKDISTGSDIADDVHGKFSDAYDGLIPKLKFDMSPEQPGIPAIPAKRPTKANPQGSQAIPEVPPVPDPYILKQIELQLTAGNLGNTGENQFNNILQNTVTSKVKRDGTMSGENLKGALSDLRQKYKGFQGSGDYNQQLLGNHLEELYDAMKDNMVRHSAPTDVQRLSELDNGYRTYAGIVRPASAKALANEGTYTPAQMAMVSRMADTSTGKGLSARGKGVQQPLAQAANAVLTKLPDSQTANRSANGKILLSLLTGGAAAHEAGFDSVAGLLAGMGAAGAASTAAYSTPGQQAAKWLLAGRQGQGAKDLASAITTAIPAGAGSQTSDTVGPIDQQTNQLFNNGAQ